MSVLSTANLVCCVFSYWALLLQAATSNRLVTSDTNTLVHTHAATNEPSLWVVTQCVGWPGISETLKTISLLCCRACATNTQPHGRHAVQPKLELLLFVQRMPTSMASFLYPPVQLCVCLCVRSLRTAHLNRQKAVCIGKNSIGVNVTLEPLETKIGRYWQVNVRKHVDKYVPQIRTRCSAVIKGTLTPCQLFYRWPLMWLLCVRDTWIVAPSVICFEEGPNDVWRETGPKCGTNFNRGMTYWERNPVKEGALRAAQLSGMYLARAEEQSALCGHRSSRPLSGAPGGKKGKWGKQGELRQALNKAAGIRRAATPEAGPARMGPRWRRWMWGQWVDLQMGCSAVMMTLWMVSSPTGQNPFHKIGWIYFTQGRTAVCSLWSLDTLRNEQTLPLLA